MTSGWNLWARLECIGVVSVCCCKGGIYNIYRYPHNHSYFSILYLYYRRRSNYASFKK